MNKILTLKHSEFVNNTENWYDNGEGGVYVESKCPTNYPAHSKYTLSFTEAMRQFILMVSDEEGWLVDEDFGWRDFVMGD